MTIIPSPWRTVVQATASGTVVITQDAGGQEQSILIPRDYVTAVCNAIYHASQDGSPTVKG